MSILIDNTKRVIVQGITGREGQARTRLMLDYGTRVVGGVTPGKGGTSVLGVPVFDTCAAAVAALGGVDVSVLFVPAPAVKDAALDAINAGVKLVVLVADRVPVWDAMEIAAAAKEKGAEFVGPNTLGIASPGQAVVGMIGGRAESAREWFKPANPTGVGIISRSGGMSSSTGYYLGQAGVRISSIVHIGGDAVLGLRVPDVALKFEQDPATDAIVVFGEIGGSQEEDLAELIRAGRVTKPVIAYIGGKAAKEGTRFSHAGAIIEGGKGTHAGKVEALRSAGATVVSAFGELPAAVVGVLKRMGSRSLMSEQEIKAKWTTAVTHIEPNRVAVRGHDIAGLMGKVSFGAAVYLILRGTLPDERVGRLMDAVLVSSIDHGATPPSTLAARTVASTGASLSQSVAAGILSINKHHGGAIEDAARFLAALLATSAEKGETLDQAAAREVGAIKASGARVSGFGHRVHTKDPRTTRLFELAAEAGLGAEGRTHIAAARAVERAFAGLGRPLPVNVDGALGAILMDLGFDQRVMNGLFMIARVPGLVAHVTEEQTRERPMRRIDPELHAYDGPRGS
jgi:succinyl-CoA synthetase alpha subunit